MLNVFRENLKSLKWLLWVVAASMTLYLGSFFTDCGAGVPGAWAARVNGAVIPSEDLLNRTRELDRQYQQVFGQNYDQMRGSLRLGSQAMEQLIQRTLILEDAARMGIVATPQDIARAIRESQSFQDESGQFIGMERYRQLFRGSGGVADFEAAVGDDIVIERWQQVIAQSITIDPGEIDELFRQRTEKTALRFAVIAAADQDIDTEIAPAVEQAWYDSHHDSYRRGEGRNVRYVVVKRADQRGKVEVTEAEVRAFYDDNRANYEFPEQRRARHILVSVPADADDAGKSAARAKAEAALARAQAGEDFGGLATELSDDPQSAAQGGDLGWFGRNRMVPEFEAAAFGTEPGSFAELTETQFGFHIILVDDRRDAGVSSLDEVEAAIRQNLQERGAEQRTQTEVARIRGSLERSADLDAVAAREGLVVEERLVFENDPLPGLGAAPDFVPSIFALSEGAVSQPLRVGTGMALVGLDAIVPSGLVPLDEARLQVRSDILTDRGRTSALAAARKALDGAKTLDAAAKTLGVELTESGDLGPASGLPATGASPADLAPVLFGDGVFLGDRAVVPVPAGAMLYEVVRREPFDPDRFITEEPQLRVEVQQRRHGQFQQSVLDRLRKSSKVEVDNSLVQRYDGIR